MLLLIQRIRCASPQTGRAQMYCRRGLTVSLRAIHMRCSFCPQLSKTEVHLWCGRGQQDLHSQPAQTPLGHTTGKDRVPQGQDTVMERSYSLGPAFLSLQGQVQPKPSLCNNDFGAKHQQNHLTECSNTFR